jgi:hypothetical protein
MDLLPIVRTLLRQFGSVPLDVRTGSQSDSGSNSRGSKIQIGRATDLDRSTFHSLRTSSAYEGSQTVKLHPRVQQVGLILEPSQDALDICRSDSRLCTDRGTAPTYRLCLERGTIAAYEVSLTGNQKLAGSLPVTQCGVRRMPLAAESSEAGTGLDRFAYFYLPMGKVKLGLDRHGENGEVERVGRATYGVTVVGLCGVGNDEFSTEQEKGEQGALVDDALAALLSLCVSK